MRTQVRLAELCLWVFVGGLWTSGCHKSAPTSPSELTTDVSATTTTTDAAGITLSATSLTFGSQALGVAGAPQSIVFTNASAGAITFTGISASGDFSETHTCGVTISPRGSCTVRVTFTPRAIGTRTGALVFADDASTGPHVIPLDGAGGVSQGLSVSPAYLEFTPALVGATSTQAVTVTNIGTTAVTVAGLTTSGDFTQTNTCSGVIAGGGTCTVTVTFTPTTSGTRAGLVTISDDAPGGPHAFPVSGQGYSDAPSVMLLPTTLFFPDQVVGSGSFAFTAQFANTGSAALEVQSVSTSGDFTQANTCPTSIAKGTFCTLSVIFRPTTTGTRTGAVIIADNAPGSPHVIALRGNGVEAGTTGPRVTLSSTGLTFETTAVGAASAEQSVTLSNTGNAALGLKSIATSADFSQTNDCGPSLLPSGSCTITARFVPTAPGTRTGTVTIEDSAAGAPHTVLLKGIGAGVGGASLVATPAVVTFGARTIGISGNGIDLTVRNNGTEAVTIREVVADGEFSASGCVSVTLAPNAECIVTVRFAPVLAGTRSGTLTLASSAPDSPMRVPLTGEGARGGLVFAPTSVTFSGQVVGATSAAQVLSFTNTLGTVISIVKVSTTGDFAVVNDCGAGIETNATCTMSVTFSPTAAGARTGTLVVHDDTDGSPHEIALKGTAF